MCTPIAAAGYLVGARGPQPQVDRARMLSFIVTVIFSCCLDNVSHGALLKGGLKDSI